MLLPSADFSRIGRILLDRRAFAGLVIGPGLLGTADEFLLYYFTLHELGAVVAAGDQFDALHTVTATMASFYTVLEHQAAWLTEQGLPYDAARSFLSVYCMGLAHDATRTDRSFAEMIEYLMTPGGLNEQLHAELSSQSAYDHYDSALDRVLARVQGRS